MPWYRQKTTLTALLGAIILVGLTLALILGKISSEAYVASLASVGSFMGVLLGVFAKDAPKRSKTQKPGV